MRNLINLVEAKVASNVNFTNDDVNSIATLDLESAKKTMIALIDKCSPGVSTSPMNPDKIRYLKNQVSQCTSVKDVVNLGYNMILAGEGLGSKTSRYGTRFTSWC